ncbi:MAG: UDP-N-acetylmuramoyl-L-alanine--D-glutamate ligase [Rhodothermales bacterium]
MNVSNIRKQKVTVIGGARSGLAVARLLASQGAKVFLTERGPAHEGLTDELDAAGVTYEFDGHTAKALDADFFVVSPGVPSTAKLVQQATKSGLGVYSEIEAASWFCEAPIIAITGSNGKTTTTSLIGHICETAGHTTYVAGNIGYPFAGYVESIESESVVVLEVSSFQLDHIDTFRPRVSLLLNITPDHLDRYDYNFNNYAQSKFRIFENQAPGDVLVYNHDDELVRTFATKAAAKRGFTALGFSITTALGEGGFVEDDHLVLRINNREERLMHVDQLALRGKHNLFNSLAAAIATRTMEIGSNPIRESLASFEGVPHRLETVRDVDGVRYVNDSKATNVNAVWYALESFREKLVLIAGGRDKGNDYSSLRPLVRQKCRAVVAIGESAETVYHQLGIAAENRVKADSMESALQFARFFAEPGDVVLLSPACSSFDMFDNYEHRGSEFKRGVWSL